MATEVAQTPGPWTLAAGDEARRRECEAALITCGIDPAAVGSYNDSAKAIRAARQRVRQSRDNGTPPGQRNPRDEALARCDAGHQVQNASFQDSRDAQGTEGRHPHRDRLRQASTEIQGRTGGQSGLSMNNACANHAPGDGPGARGYDAYEAPCIPTPGSWTPSRGRRSRGYGTTHYQVSRQEDQFYAQQTGATSGADIQRQAQQTQETVRNSGTEQQRIQRAQQGAATAMGGRQNNRVVGAAKRRARSVEQMRTQAIRRMQQDAGGQGSGTSSATGPDPTDPSADAAKARAAAEALAQECMEEDRQRRMDRMRAKCIDEYGDGGDAAAGERRQQERMQRLRGAEDQARRDANGARSRAQEPNLSTEERQERERAAVRAERRYAEAEQERRNAGCLREQAVWLEQNTPNPHPRYGTDAWSGRPR